MHIALCVRYRKAVYRLIWLTESKAGFYVGLLGAEEDTHASYHQDGTRHTKIGTDHHNRFSDTPINTFAGFNQLDHFSLSLTKNWFNSKTEYLGDMRTESIVLIDERMLINKDTLVLDVWLTDRGSEMSLLQTIQTHLISDPKFSVVGQFVLALVHFPGHKVALTLRSARIRDITPEQLMFRQDGA